jgi:hypothetical protein
MSGRTLDRALALVALGLAAVPTAAQAQLQLPSVCAGEATGLTDVVAAGGAPLIEISYTMGSTNAYVDETRIVMVEQRPVVAFEAPTSVRADNFLLVVTYTPFLQSYQAIIPTPRGPSAAALPPAGWFTDPRYRLIGRLALTVRAENGILPQAIVEIAPEFPGSSPFTMQADSNGMIGIACFSYRPNISVTAYDASGTLYQGTILLDQISAPVVAEATGTVVLAPVD